MKLSVVLEFGPKDSFSFSSQYIGGKANLYLIIDFPAKVKERLIMRKVNNTRIVIRGVSDTKDGDIIAFQSSTLALINNPTGLLFIRSPQHFARKPIREHERYKIDVDATIDFAGQKFSAHFVDFSVSGCALLIKDPNELEEKHKVTVISELDELCQSEFSGQVTSVAKSKVGTKIGIRFNEEIELNDKLRSKLLEEAFNANSSS
nr:PilZ domain-containing protein [Vibrio sinus]